MWSLWNLRVRDICNISSNLNGVNAIHQQFAWEVGINPILFATYLVTLHRKLLKSMQGKQIFCIFCEAVLNRI